MQISPKGTSQITIYKRNAKPKIESHGKVFIILFQALRPVVDEHCWFRLEAASVKAMQNKEF